MKFVKGRDNLSVTVYVPYNCANDCKFCTSKEEYSKGVDAMKTIISLRKIRNSIINEVVFTGGEPMVNIEALKLLVEIVDNKDVYINTSFLELHNREFCDFVNSTPCIKGVNISRHKATFKEDKKMLNGISEDSMIKSIKKPVKINVVLRSDELDKDFLKNVMARWSKFPNTMVCFRENYSLMTFSRLHILFEERVYLISSLGEYRSRSLCDVCDTISFENEYGKYSYHRGVLTTSIKIGENTTQVNDIIIFPNGEICYDWDRKKDNIEDMFNEFKIGEVNDGVGKNPITKQSTPQPTIRREPIYRFSCGFGVVSCGM